MGAQRPAPRPPGTERLILDVPRGVTWENFTAAMRLLGVFTDADVALWSQVRAERAGT